MPVKYQGAQYLITMVALLNLGLKVEKVMSCKVLWDAEKH